MVALFQTHQFQFDFLQNILRLRCTKLTMSVRFIVSNISCCDIAMFQVFHILSSRCIINTGRVIWNKFISCVTWNNKSIHQWSVRVFKQFVNK